MTAAMAAAIATASAGRIRIASGDVPSNPTAPADSSGVSGGWSGYPQLGWRPATMK
jgi:hypothetical protein